MCTVQFRGCLATMHYINVRFASYYITTYVKTYLTESSANYSRISLSVIVQYQLVYTEVYHKLYW